MQAIILCGGLSTRLGKTTETLPKILLKIGTRTVLESQLSLLAEAGVKDVILATGHLHDVLYEQVGETYQGLTIKYAREEERLGTGGAIKNGLRFVVDFPLFVLHGDILLKDISLRDMLTQLRPEMDGLLLGVSVSDLTSYGEIVADSDGHITAFKEKQQESKPGIANAAVFLFNRSIVKYFPQRKVFSIEREVFPYAKKLYVHTVSTEWIDIGVPDRLEYARKHFVE